MIQLPIAIAARSLIRAPGFALIAVLTLALGIGMSTAVFTVADGILIRRLPVGDQDRLVVLWSETREQTASWPLAIDDARELARRRGALEHTGFVGYYGSAPETIQDGDQVYRLRRSLVSGNFFEVLQTQPVLGRALRAEDDLVGAALVAVLNYRAWRQQFGGDPAIVGRQLLIHDTGRAYRIVGVMPQGLDYPAATDFWAPLVATSTGSADSLNLVSLHLVGRLRPGASRADAEAEVTSYFHRPEASSWSRDLRGAGQPLPTLVLGRTKPAVLIFAAAAGLLLLLTSINVANLLLVRGLGRARELAVRSALGAGRRRLVGQLLLESALLALAGGVLGLALAAASVRGFVAIAPADIPRLDEIHLNSVAILAAIGITAAATMLFALAPAFATSRVTLHDVLRAGSRQSGGGRRVRIVMEGLVAAQIALAVMVLFAAGLVGKSLLKLQRVDLSYQPRRVLIGELALRGADGTARQVALLDGVLARVAALPGVEAVSPALTVPFAPTGFGIDGFLVKPGQAAAESAKNPLLNIQIVAPNYFATLGIPVVRGRPFSASDREGGMPVVIVSESTARYYWPGTDPLGQTLGFSPSDPRLTVVGVVPDTRYRELRTARPSVYFPLRQPVFPVVPLVLVIRTAGSPASTVGALRKAIAEVDPDVVLARASPLETFLDQPRAQPRLNALLLAAFAAAAVLLAAVGLFGVIATMVRQRTRELGIRMALGATPGGMRRLVMGRGLAIAVAGTMAGIGGALVTSRLLTDLLFEVGPWDRVTLAIAAALILGVAAIASFYPAQASMRIDAGISLRSDG